GRTGLALLPAIGWLIVIFAAGTKRSEGDLLITGNNWVGIATIVLGAVAWGVAAYVSIIRGMRRPESASPLAAGLRTRQPGVSAQKGGKAARPGASGSTDGTRPGGASAAGNKTRSKGGSGRSPGNPRR